MIRFVAYAKNQSTPA